MQRHYLIALALLVVSLGCSGPKYYHLDPDAKAFAGTPVALHNATFAVAQAEVSMEYENDAILHQSGKQLSRQDNYRWLASVSDMSTKTIAEICLWDSLTLVDVGQNQHYTLEPHVLEFVTEGEHPSARVTMQVAVFDERAPGGRRAILTNTYTEIATIENADWNLAAQAFSTALTKCCAKALSQLSNRIEG